MKLKDKLKIAVKSIINNKSRSILTIIIVVVVSLMILSIMMIALNFSSNTKVITETSARKSPSSIYINRNYKTLDYEPDKYAFFDNEDVKLMSELFSKYNNVITNVTYDSYMNFNAHFFSENIDLTSNEFYNLETFNNSYSSKITDFAFPLGIDGAIIDGRIWTKDDVGTNHIWVKDSYINSAYTKGTVLEVGSKVWIQSEIYDYRKNPNKADYFSHEYEIMGIISTEKIEDHRKQILEIYPNYYSFESSDLYFDITYFQNTLPTEYTINSVNVSYFPPQSSYDFNQLYGLVDGLVKELKLTFPNENDIELYVTSTLIDEFMITKIMTTVIISFAAALGFIILLLSIGSVSNTIIISVDKNKKFIGLMKALGLKQRQVEDIVRIEAIITIAIGILISTIILYILLPLFVTINESIINLLFSYQLSYIEHTTRTSVPLYLPFAVAIVFILMTLIFSRSSLRTISKMDVITIISEVS
jgi:ABC-type antimicrobial peptide transport system permease subunit